MAGVGPANAKALGATGEKIGPRTALAAKGDDVRCMLTLGPPAAEAWPTANGDECTWAAAVTGTTGSSTAMGIATGTSTGARPPAAAAGTSAAKAAADAADAVMAGGRAKWAKSKTECATPVAALRAGNTSHAGRASSAAASSCWGGRWGPWAIAAVLLGASSGRPNVCKLRLRCKTPAPRTTAVDAAANVKTCWPMPWL